MKKTKDTLRYTANEIKTIGRAGEDRTDYQYLHRYVQTCTLDK
jgi:hypothetical protein